MQLHPPLSEPCPLNDLDAEEVPLQSELSVDAASVVTGENVFVDSDADEQDGAMSNKVTEAVGMCINVLILCVAHHHHKVCQQDL